MTATTMERITKERRLLIEGRLTVTRVLWNSVTATCKGDSGEVYDLGFEAGHWFCSCEARSTCSHLKALMLVAVRDRA